MAIVDRDGGVDLFIDGRKLGADVRRHLADVRLQEPAGFDAALDALGAARKTVQIDPATSGAYLARRLTAAGATLMRCEDPCLLPKACKTAAELDGSRAAHRRDGAAVSRFLAWPDAPAPPGGDDEPGSAAKLDSCRRLDQKRRG